MTVFWKVTAGILIASILTSAIGKQENDIALLLAMGVSVMATLAALYVLEPVLEFIHQLEAIGNLQKDRFCPLMKIAGVGLATELAGLICQDSGNAALNRGMQLMGTAVMLSLSVPVMEAFLNIVQKLLGEL